MRKTNELQAAYDHFAKRVGRLLVRKGASHTAATYKLETPGGSLILWVQRNWIFGRFENPVGGFIVTRGLSQEHSGRWATNFHDNVDALTSENLLAGFEQELDQMLGFQLTDEQRQAIEREAEASARLVAIVDAVEHDADSETVLGRIQAYERARLNKAGATTGRFRVDGPSTPRQIAS